jgi:hypothetical protein
MNATMVPKGIAPRTASTAPTTQTTTYARFPTKIISGIMRPERNWLFHAQR